MFALISIMSLGMDTCPALLAAASALTAAYVVCLIVGCGLLVVSTIFGHHADADTDVDFDAHVDADMGVDADADVHIEADADAAHIDHAAEGFSLATWFSVRFLVYFVATFGLVGTVLSYTSPAGMWVVLIAAIAAGVVVGQVVHQTLRYLKRTSGDSQASVQDFLNRGARVTLAIAAGQRGEVALQVRGRERFVPALPRRQDDTFKVGDPVTVVAYANGTAEVISREEYDFVHEHEKGEDS